MLVNNAVSAHEEKDTVIRVSMYVNHMHLAERRNRNVKQMLSL